MLKTLRVILALLSITMVTLLFLDFTGMARHLWPWMAEVQLVPAILSANIAAIAFVLLLTVVCGRLYCSVICPLGIFQDVVNRLRIVTDKFLRKRSRFRYSRNRTRLRLGVLTIFVVLLVLSMVHLLSASIASLIEPYSAYGRMASELMAPAYDGVNNMLASWAESAGSYTFYRVTTIISIPVLAVAIVTLIVITVMAWRGGRDYCNRICPVGTALGYLSRYSILRPVIDKDKCRRCGKCAHRCKAKCIDTHHHYIDYSRCVTCFDCIGNCKEGAISYTWRRYRDPEEEERRRQEKAARSERHHHHHHHHHHHSEETSRSEHTGSAIDYGRRAFMAGVGFLTGAVAAKALSTDGGLTPLMPKQPVDRKRPVVPAGAVSLRHLSQHCTACQLCVQQCPQHILKPTMSFEGFMQPTMDFTDGYCPPQCTACSSICPTDAIGPIDVAQKSSVKIGSAEVALGLCISAAYGKKCGSCASHCPAGAITMVEMDDGSGHKMPVVRQSLCIGCGSCEYHCPVGTVESTKGVSSAIHVEGLDTHHLI